MTHYTLTITGYLATIPRGNCGHILCHQRPACIYQEQS